MRPASDLFLAAVRQSHVIAAGCELIFPDDPLTPVAVPVEAGSVTIDRTAQSRRAGSIQIPWSLQAGADLGVDLRTLPLGGYAIVSRGLRYADGTTELIQLGRLRVESVTWNTLEASASLELSDRMAQVRDEPFTAPYGATGKTPAEAAFGIVQGVFDFDIDYHKPYDPPDVLGAIAYSGQRSDALAALEQSHGAEIYFDADGDFVFDQLPGDGDPVVWTVDAGELGVMVDTRESLDRTGIYNGVLVTGQAAADEPPITGLATFDEPTSAVRWGGPFGKVCLLASSTSVPNDMAAAATAESLLNLRLKQTRSLELTAAPNPALEAGDTISVVFPDGREETHLVDATTIALDTAAQRIITRTLTAPTTPIVDRLFYGHDAWRQLNDARLVAA